jgi:hypothetical protein
MRLTELEPRWIGLSGTVNPSGEEWHEGDGTVTFGISFLCPKTRDHRIAVQFEPHLGDVAHTHWPAGLVRIGQHIWTRGGDTFDTLTLSPSIDASQYTECGGGCWHGFIRNGEVVA